MTCTSILQWRGMYQAEMFSQLSRQLPASWLNKYLLSLDRSYPNRRDMAHSPKVKIQKALINFTLRPSKQDPDTEKCKIFLVSNENRNSLVLCPNLFIQPFSKYLLSTYYILTNYNSPGAYCKHQSYKFSPACPVLFQALKLAFSQVRERL